MILKFSNELDSEEDQSFKKNMGYKICYNCMSNMRRNMMKFMRSHDLSLGDQFLNKSNSQKHFELAKKSKKDNLKEEIIKNQHDNIYNNYNVQIEKNNYNDDNSKDKRPIIINMQLKKENKIDELKEGNKNNRNNGENNSESIDQKSENLVQKEDELNQNNKNLINLTLDNIKNAIKFNDSNNNVPSTDKNTSNNQIANYIGIENNINISPLNQIETFSVNSENDNSKNIKDKRETINSSSSYRKNFVLKTEIIKSNKHLDNQNKKNNYSDNPIMNYYSGKHFSNFTNFYMADIKSPEEIDDAHYMNFFPNKESSGNDKKSISYSPIEHNQRNIIKENNDIFGEEDNNDDKLKFEKSNIINNDSIENKLNLDFINNSSSIIEDSPNNNIIQIDTKNININYKDFNENNNLENLNFNNINNNNNFRPPLDKSNVFNNNNNIINLENNNFNNFNNVNFSDNINNVNNLNSFNFNNNNNIFNINNINNMKELTLNKELLSEMSKIDLNKLNLNFQGVNTFQIPNNYNNYYTPSQILNNKFNYYSFNNKEMTINGLPSGKSFYEYTDEDILQYAIPLIKDQSGCRFLQERMKISKSFMIDKLFPVIQNYLFELGCDSFGNYFLQALIDIFSYDNLNQFLDLIRNDFIKMCTNQHGTRVIQKIIDKVSSDKNFASKLENILNTKELGIIIQSPYGNHIIQKFIVSIHYKEYTKFIYDYSLQHFMEITETKHGVCVIQKCVSEGDTIQRVEFYNLIIKNFEELIQDEFGNYLIQYILLNIKTKEMFDEAFFIIKKIEDNLIDICKNKFSANIIEKCLENGDNYINQYLLDCILNRYREHIIELLLDKYGIYIIQKAIKINSFYKNKFYEIIKEKKDELKNIDLNDFKYRGVQKVMNSFKDLELFHHNQNMINNDSNNNINNYIGNYNNFYNSNSEYRNNYNNNKRKNKRGRKNFRGK